MVFRFPEAGTGWSVRPSQATGSVKVEPLEGEHVRIHLDFDTSPSNIGGQDMVFHINDVLESRPRD